MQPVNANNLVKYGDSFKRLGPTKRVEPFSTMKSVEDAILKYSALPCSADIIPLQAPYFTEFTYADILGGMLLRSFSAEINSRVINSLEYEKPDQKILDLFNAGIKDKYQMNSGYTGKHKSVVFLCGHNVFDRIVDTQLLYRIMDSDKSIVIKPHPITNDDLLRNLGANFGYDRILNKDISGIDVLRDCETVYGLSSSEISLVAILQEKHFVDITAYLQAWGGNIYPFLRATEHLGRKARSEIIESLFLNPKSGFLLPSMDEETLKYRINSYCSAALKEREPFEMVTPQRLMIVNQTVSARKREQHENDKSKQ